MTNKISGLNSVQNYSTNTTAYLSISSAITGYVETFPAFLTDFSQTFTSNWNTEEVYGRNDPIATFQGTKRTISLAFDIPSINVEDARNNLRKTSNLIKMLYPGYIDVKSSQPNDDPNKPAVEKVIGSVMAKSPLVKVKFSNLIVSQDGSDGLLGWIGSLSWKPNLEMGMFIGTGAPKGLYPKAIALSFELNVLHRDRLGQTGKSRAGTVNGWLGGANKTKYPFGDL